jgi:inosose dehydratase
MTNSERQVRLAISPLSWTNDVLADLGEDIPLEVCLTEASEIGYEGTELGRKYPKDPKVLAPKLAEYGLVLAAGWYSGLLAVRSVEEEWSAVANHLQLLKGCGSRVLVYGEDGKMPSLDFPLSESPELGSIDLPDYAKKVREFSDRLSQEGVVLAYHHHLMMLVEKAEEIVAFCEATGDKVGLLLDTGHAYAAGADYREIIQKFGNRIVHIHLKDVRKKVLESVRERDLSFNDAVREGLFTVPGDGDLDFGEVAAFVRTSGYRGWVVVEAEQDPAKAEPRAYAGKAFAYVKQLMF